MAACGSILAGSPSGPDRQMRISKVAYHKVPQRGFAPGHDWEDWVAAEREVTGHSKSSDFVRPSRLGRARRYSRALQSATHVTQPGNYDPSEIARSGFCRQIRTPAPDMVIQRTASEIIPRALITLGRTAVSTARVLEDSMNKSLLMGLAIGTVVAVGAGA